MRIVLNLIFLSCLFAYSYNLLIALLIYREDIIKFNKFLSSLLRINFY